MGVRLCWDLLTVKAVAHMIYIIFLPIKPCSKPLCSIDGGPSHAGRDHSYWDKNVSSKDKGDPSDPVFQWSEVIKSLNDVSQCVMTILITMLGAHVIAFFFCIIPGCLWKTTRDKADAQYPSVFVCLLAAEQRGLYRGLLAVASKVMLFTVINDLVDSVLKKGENILHIKSKATNSSFQTCLSWPVSVPIHKQSSTDSLLNGTTAQAKSLVLQSDQRVH